MRRLLSATDDVQASRADILGLAPLHEVVLNREREEPDREILVVLVEVETRGLRQARNAVSDASREGE